MKNIYSIDKPLIMPVEKWQEFLKEYDKLERKLAMRVVRNNKKEIKK